jgi:membrane protein
MLGGLFTSVLFTVGQALIGLYLGRTNVGTAFGAAGSLVVVLVWIYYSSMILFLRRSSPRRTPRCSARVSCPAGRAAIADEQRGRGHPRRQEASRPLPRGVR